LGALAPVPLVISLTAYDWQKAISLVENDYWLVIASLASAIVTAAFLFKARRPVYLISKGSAQWLLLSLGGGATYLIGSYYGSSWLHWAGIPLVYFGLVMYLCGRRFGAYLAPPVAMLSTIVVPYFAGAVVGYVTAAGLVLYTGLIVLAIRNYKVLDTEECESCPSYRAIGFCENCGTKVGHSISIPLPTKGLIIVAVISALVISSLVQVTVPIVSLTGSGLQVNSYRASGLVGSTNLTSFPGFETSLIGTQSNQSLTSFSYKVVGNESVRAIISLSSSQRASSEGALSFYNESALVGTQLLTADQAAFQYAWSQDGVNYTGLLVQSPLAYLSDGRIVQSSAAFFFVQATSNSTGPATHAVTTLANATSSRLQGVKGGYPILTMILGPLSSNMQYVTLAAALVFFGLVGGIARSLDLKATRRFDNSLALSGPEMEVLSAIARGPKDFTRRDLVERIIKLGDSGVDVSFPEKLLRCDLASKEIVSRNGSPILVWAFKVRL